jgi:hypothetical protein
MNAGSDQTSFSLAEFMVASVAMAVVAVIAFQGIWGSREANLSAANLSRSRAFATGRPLQVSPWRLDSPDANTRVRSVRTSDIVSVRKTEPFGPGSVAGGLPGRRPGGTPPSTFFAEAAPATAVDLSPDSGAPPGPLIGPPDLFRMPNAIPAAPVKPTKETVIPPRPEGKRESR